MRIRPSALRAPVLALFMLLAVRSAGSVDFSRSTEYPSPSGLYQTLTASYTFRAGVPTTAAPILTAATANAGTANPANAAQGSLTINGNAYVNLLDASFTDTTGAEFSSTQSLRDMNVDEKIQVDGNTFRTRSISWGGESHWIYLNISGTPSSSQRSAEMHVNGDIYAQRFRASQQRTQTDNEQLLFFGPNNDGGGDDGDWVEMRARSGTSTAPGGWEDSQSILRVKGNPYVILNGYSGANVGVGTANPQYLLQVGDAGAGLQAIGHSWQVFSSREFKTDLAPYSAADYARAADAAGRMNLVRFHYKEDDDSLRKKFGVIAEEAPKEILSRDGKAVSLGDSAGFLFAAVRGLRDENRALRAEIAKLEKELGAEPGRAAS